MENVQDIYPLSPMQEGMLFHSIYSPNAIEYKEQFSCKINSEINIDAFKKAWEKVIERHDILRTAFVWEDLAEPLQIVHKKIELPFSYQDISSNNDKKKLLENIVRDCLKTKIDFTSAPLMRITLLKLNINEYYLIWDHHHILFDGWGLPIIITELLKIYASLTTENNFKLNPTFPYKNYIAWLKKQNEEKSKEFWSKRLNGFSIPTELKLPFKDFPKEGYSKKKYQLSNSLTNEVSTIKTNKKITINTLIQATWALLLSYYTDSTDVVFGATLSGRNADIPGIDQMLGLFINTLPVRAKINNSQKIIEWLKEFQIAQSELQEFEYSALFKIQTWSDIPKGESLFNTILVLENYPINETIEGTNEILKITDLNSFEKTNYPLTLVISPGRQIGLEIAFDTMKFDDYCIDQIFNRFVIILSSIVKNISQPIDYIDFTSPEEKQFLYNISFDRYGNKFEFSNTVEWFENIVSRNPNKTAIVSYEGSITFDELNKKANQVANYLVENKIQCENIVGLCLDRSIDMIVNMIAISKVGGAILPIDINYPHERIKYIIEDSNLAMLITKTSVIDKIESLDKKFIEINELNSVLKKYDNKNLNIYIDDKNLSYLIYTSGSTGKPKATCLQHFGLCNFVINTKKDFKFSDDEKIIQFASLGFDAAMGEIFSSLLTEATLYIPQREITLSEIDLTNYINNNNITFAYLPPSFLSIIDSNKFSSKLKIASVGDKCSESLAKKWGTKLIFYNGYGPTETTIGASFIKYEKNYSGVNSYPIGKPFGNVKVYLLNEKLNQVPIGVPGEIYISGYGVGRGYLKRPDLTAEKFLPDIITNEAGLRMYKTGDIAKYLPDGNIEFLGRKDFQVKIRGYRIELNEIEAIFLQHNMVKEVIVVDNKDEKGDEYLSAYVIKQNEELSEEEIKSFIKKRLPQFMIPKTINFLKEFPLTFNRKIDRKKLPRPDFNNIDLNEEPKTSTEKVIGNIWCDILKVDKVSRNSNFFDLGGHSLLATQLVSRLRDTFKKEIPFSAVFETADLKSLSKLIENELVNKNHFVIERVSRKQKFPLSYSQQRLWFLDQLKPNDPSYNIPTVLRLKGELNIKHFEQALNLIINKYEILRTSFDELNGKPFQRIHESLHLKIENIILEGITLDDKLSNAQNIIKEKLLVPFILKELPLIRCERIEIENNDNILFFVVHHIIADGWSIVLIINELINIYSSLQKNKKPEVEKLEVEFADYAVWQRDNFLSENYNNELAYWKEELKEIPTLLELPYDKPKPSIQTTSCDKVNLVLEESLVIQFNKLVRSENSTLFMGFLSAFQFLLSKYSNMNDIVVGTPIAGRDNLLVEKMVGFFVNNLAIRTRINNNESFRDLLTQVRDTTLRAYSNQTLPFDKIVEELHPVRDLSHQPIFQVMFVFQNLPSTDTKLDKLVVIPFELETQTTNYDLTITLQETKNGIEGSIDFNSDLFLKGTIERFADNYKILIRKIIEHSDETLKDIQILSDIEKTKILNQWNFGKILSNNKNVVELFEKAVKEFINEEAVAYKTNNSKDRSITLTFSELNKKVNRLANYLVSQNVKSEDKIAICMHRHENMIISMFSILKARGAFVPIDSSLPLDRIKYMLEMSDCSKIIMNNSTNEILEKIDIEKINLDKLEKTIYNQSKENLNLKIDLENLAYIIFTSGSTGMPKGVMLNHKGLANLSLVQKNAFNISNYKKIMQFSSLSFDASVWETVMALLNGGSLYLTSKEVISSGYELAEYIENNNITTITLPPSVLSILPIKEYPALDTLITAGEAISNKVVSIWSKNRKYFNAYGPTETTVCATILSLTENYPKGPPIGKSINNFETYILDPYLYPVGIGVPGELCIGGVGLARGYINQSDLTAEKFIPNPFSKNKGERLYKTGDLVRYLPDGNIEFIGRVDTQIKLRGFRIEVSEIEQNLKNIEFIKDAKVVVKNFSQNQEMLVGYIVCEENLFDKDKIQTYLKDKLPEYMLPALFVRIDEMPLTTSGKVDKTKLLTPEFSRNELSNEYIAPRNEGEKKLVKIVEELLNINKVGIKDNFFELGGHSLLATQFISRIKDEFNKEVKLIKIFEEPTIEGVYKNIENKNTEINISQPAIQKISRENRRIKRTDLT